MESVEIMLTVGDTTFKYVRDSEDDFKWSLHVLHDSGWSPALKVDTNGADVLYEVSRYTSIKKES